MASRLPLDASISVLNQKEGKKDLKVHSSFCTGLSCIRNLLWPEPNQTLLLFQIHLMIMILHHLSPDAPSLFFTPSYINKMLFEKKDPFWYYYPFIQMPLSFLCYHLSFSSIITITTTIRMCLPFHSILFSVDLLLLVLSRGDHREE